MGDPPGFIETGVGWMDFLARKAAEAGHSLINGMDHWLFVPSQVGDLDGDGDRDATDTAAYFENMSDEERSAFLQTDSWSMFIRSITHNNTDGVYDTVGDWMDGIQGDDNGR